MVAVLDEGLDLIVDGRAYYKGLGFRLFIVDSEVIGNDYFTIFC